MKKILITALTIGICCSCGGSAARSKRTAQTAPAAAQTQPKTYTYRIVAAYPHSTEAYTQGLYCDNGLLWEGTGQYGESRVQTIDLTTGKTDVLARLPRSEFGEGIARVGDELFQLTWKTGNCEKSATTAIPVKAGGSRPTARNSTCPTARPTSTRWTPRRFAAKSA